MSIYLGIPLMLGIFFTHKYFVHKKERANVEQIIFMTIVDGTFVSIETLLPKVQEYEMHVSYRYLHRVLKQLVKRQSLVEAGKDWLLLHPKVSRAYRLASFKEPDTSSQPAHLRLPA